MDKATARTDRWGRLGAVMIVVAVVAAYLNSFGGPFVFDDQATLQDNPSIRQLWPLGPALHPPANGSPVTGRPLTNLSFAVNFAIGGLAVRGYHVVALLIHGLAALALFGVVRRTLTIPSARRPGATDPAWPDEIALAAAVIWAVHPLTTEAVTYLAQRSESLMGLFYLFSLYGFIRGVDATGTGPRRRHAWLGLSWLACLGGMAAKEVMVTAPMMILLYDRTFVAGSFRTAWARRRAYYVGLAGTWLLLAFLMIGTDSRGGTVGFHTSVPWWGYAAAQFRAIVHYFGLSLWPHPLLIDYGLAWRGALLPTLLCGLLVGAAVVVTVVAVARRRPLGFLGAWFFAILAPTSSIVPIATEIVAEHRMYLPLAAVAVACVIGLYRLAGKLGWLPCVALAVGLAAVTWRRNEDYRSARALWSETVRQAPANPGAHNNLGRALLAAQEFDAAGREFSEALRLDPALPGAWNNAGAVDLHEGKAAEAIAAYENALRLVPDYADAADGLGRAWLRAGRLPEAVAQFNKVLQLRPDAVETHNLLAFALYQSGQSDAAIAEYQATLRLKPDYTDANYNLGNLLARSGRLAESITCFESVMRVRPDWVELRINLGSALLQVGRTAEAIEHFQAAARLRPDYGAAHYDLAIALRAAGRTNEAQTEFETAARLGVNPP